jgi:hypothetical protein
MFADHLSAGTAVIAMSARDRAIAGTRATCGVELRSDEIGAWRATLPEGHRFEATQALRQLLNRGVAWKIIDSNPAKAGVDNPRRQHPEKRPVRVMGGDRRLVVPESTVTF